MKKNALIIALLFFMPSANLLNARHHIHSVCIEDDPFKLVSLLEKYEGSPGYPVYNWYLKNSSTNKAIRVTVQFKNSSPDGSEWTSSFDVEPGAIMNIGNKTYDGVSYSYAKIVGARFIN